MFLLPPAIYRPRRGRPKRKKSAAAPAVALTLVAAEYDPDVFVTLTFDRAIDVAALDGQAVVVDDRGFEDKRYAASGPATLLGPATVTIELVQIGVLTGAGDVRPTAGAGSGIVAVDDGGTWAGVVGLVLPFP